MHVLAIDTALGACSAAVLSVPDGRLARAYEERARGHAEALMPMIEAVMAEAGVAYRALDRIAVTTGPGTFTGCRIGVATARALALAARVPLVGETSLAVMAGVVRERVPERGDGPLVIAVDARRGQIYFGVYGAGGEAIVPPCLSTPQDAAGLLHGASLIAGSGAGLVAEAAEAQGFGVESVLPDLQPDAAILARMALEREPDDRPVSPLYLRPPDAKPQVIPAVDLGK